jgi:hypothetical protein
VKLNLPRRAQNTTIAVEVKRCVGMPMVSTLEAACELIVKHPAWRASKGLDFWVFGREPRARNRDLGSRWRTGCLGDAAGGKKLLDGAKRDIYRLRIAFCTPFWKGIWPEIRQIENPVSIFSLFSLFSFF